MGRAKNKESEAKTRVVSVRIDIPLYETLAARAEAEGVRLTHVLTDRLQAGGGASRADMRKVAELHRIGILLKQHAHSHDERVKLMLDEVRAAIMRIVPHLP